MRISFEGSLLKIQRAKKHLQEFSNEVESFKKNGFCELDITPLDDGTCEVSLTITKKLPIEISLMLGDALYNLRSSLDHLLTEILNGYGAPIDKLQFPIADNVSKLNKSGVIPVLIQHCPEASELILNVIKPYELGNYELWALNKLNNIDKHRLLLTVSQGSAAGLEGHYRDESRFGVMFTNIRDIVDEPSKIVLSKHIGRVDKFNLPTIEVFFGKNGYFDDYPIEKVMSQITEAVESTIGQFQNIEY